MMISNMSLKQVCDKKNKYFSCKNSYKKKEILIFQEFNLFLERLNFSNITHDHQHKKKFSQELLISTGL